jgi:hypothetical protein
VKAKTILTAVILAFVAVSVVYLIIKETRPAEEADGVGERRPELAGAETAASPTLPAADRAVVVTYYYNTAKRCPSCIKIERLSREAVESGFPEELKEGKVVWRLVNTDEPANKHYVKDYGLYAKSLIVSDVRGGEEVRWKNLMTVWQLTNDKGLFIKYVQDEVRAYLTGE